MQYIKEGVEFDPRSDSGTHLLTIILQTLYTVLHRPAYFYFQYNS